MTSSIDVLIVLYNSSKFIHLLLDSLRRLRTPVPVTIYFLDNASTDKTVEKVTAAIPELPFRTYLLRSLTNNGFGRGMNLLGRQGAGEFLFMLNQDTELEEDCLEKLFSRAISDPTIGICEARQSPREHPKRYDPGTGETGWCAAAAVLVRRKSFEEIGGFDERLFFMYCEDVDLSWKFWLRGWKCIYVPEALVQHYTQDLMPGKRRSLENYFSFRNSLFLFYRFGRRDERRILYTFLLNRFVFGKYSFRSKLLYAFAFVDHIRYIPYLLRTRRLWCADRHPRIRFEETSLAE